MDILTKFKINDLIQSKYAKNPNGTDGTVALEILEINTVTCSAGTQVFYHCRPLFMIYETDYAVSKFMRKVIDIQIGDNNKEIFYRVREDEVKVCPKEIADQIIQQNIEEAS